MRLSRDTKKTIGTLAVILSLLVPSGSILGQDLSLIDSLKQELENTANPDERAMILIPILDFYIQNDLDLAKKYTNTALHEAENDCSPDVKSRLYSKVADFYRYDRQFNQAIDYYTKARNGYIKTQSYSDVAWIGLNLGMVYIKMSQFEDSFDIFLESLKLYEEQEDSLGIAEVYSCMGNLAKSQSNYQKSLDYYYQSLSYKSGMNDIEGEAETYNNLGAVYGMLGNSDLALSFYMRSEELLDSIGEYKNRAVLLGNIGSALIDHKRFDEVTHYLDEGLKIHKKHGNERGIGIMYHNYGEYYRQTGNPQLGIEYYLKAYEIYEKLSLKSDLMIKLCADLSETYASVNDYENAYFYLTLNRQYYDQLQNMDFVRYSLEKENEYSLLKEKEILSLLEQKKRIFNTALVAAFILTIIIIVLILSRLRSKNKEYRLENSNVSLKNDQILKDLEYKHKELAYITIQKIKMGEMINSVISRLVSTKENLKEENLPVIAEIVQDLKKSADYHSWEDFEKRFLQVYNSFYDNLLESFPELTINERRLAAFLRLDLSTKEISTITNQTPHSINVARTRLRKKLGLANTEVDLVQFLSRY